MAGMKNSPQDKSIKSEIILRIVDEDGRSDSAPPRTEGKSSRVLDLLDKSSKMTYNIFKIIFVIAMIFFIVYLVSWVYDKNEGVIIESFQVSGMNNVSGKNIADLLNYNINDIKILNSFGPEAKKDRLPQNSQIIPLSDEKSGALSPTLSGSSDTPSLAVGDESLEKSLSGIGDVGVEGVSFSLGNLILAMKGLVGREPISISGSLQKYDSAISLVAMWKDPSNDEVSVWEVRRNLSKSDPSLEMLIPEMINNMAFQIVHERCIKRDTSGRIYPQTWEAFKNLTIARKEYIKYANTKNERCLSEATDRAASIRIQEPQFVGEKEIDLLSDLSSAFMEQNRLNDAENLYKAIFEIKPFESNIGIGSIHGRMRDFDVALRFFNNSTQINPMSTTAWIYKGRAHEGLNQHEAAIKSYKKATDIDDKSYRAWNNIGWNLYIMNKNSASIEAFEKAIKINISYASAWNNKGLVYDKMGENKLALNAYKLAVRYDPKFPSPWMYVFSWPASRLAFGDYSILFVPKSPVSS